VEGRYQEGVGLGKKVPMSVSLVLNQQQQPSMPLTRSSR
jgi:hypothetical protein